MELNPQIKEILKNANIDVSEGTLCLLAVYYSLSPEKTCSEEVIKAINLTKIITKDYKNRGKIVWTIPLYAGQDTNFSWVWDWIEAFGRVNPERKGSSVDATTRMEEFFRKYPQYRKDDVYEARDRYLRSLDNPKFCMHSHKFIFDGQGVMKKSTLLQWCETVAASKDTTNPHMIGKIIH